MNKKKLFTNENNQIIKRYNDRLDSKGYKHEALGWTRKNVTIRLNELISLIKPSSDKLKIVDVGCGLGTLIECLEYQKIDFSYKGLDINPRLITKCKKLYPTYDFLVIDENFRYDLLDFDYAVISGVFNHTRADGLEKVFMEETVKDYFELAKKGVIWNLLTDRVEYTTEYNVNFNVQETINFCYTLSDSIAFMNTQLRFEASFAIYKSNFDRNSLRLII